MVKPPVIVESNCTCSPLISESSLSKLEPVDAFPDDLIFSRPVVVLRLINLD